MSDNFVAEFASPQSGGHPHDLLARLYREIGISAVAAALDAVRKPTPPATTVESSDDRRIPAVPQCDDLAA